MVQDTVDILKPVDAVKTDGHEPVTVWPWFDMAGKSPKADRLWAEYRTARRSCGLPEDYRLGDTYAVTIEVIDRSGVVQARTSARVVTEDDMERARRHGTYIRDLPGERRERRHPIDSLGTYGGQVYDAGDVEHLQKFAHARAALKKAVVAHLDN